MSLARPLRVAFVAPYGYAVLAGSEDIRLVGGAEVQQALIASELAQRGHDVSMISMDLGQTEGLHRSGVRVFRLTRPSAGLPGLRFIYPFSTSLYRAMRRADAEVYYQRCAGALTGMVVALAQMLGRRSVFASASDSDFDLKHSRIELARDKLLFKYGIRNVDQIVVQSERQLFLCRSAFMRNAVQINSCYTYSGAPGLHHGPIIWVGSFRAVKRVDIFLELARRLPQYQFLLIGGSPPNDSERFEIIKRQAQAVSNLTLVGHTPIVEVELHFDGASLLVNTSDSEGFPNTFLQAWSRGIPTVSFFNSEARQDGADVGRVVASIEEMVSAIIDLKENPRLWRECGSRAAAHFAGKFTVSRAADAYERVFAEVMLRE